jgi:hypothetical protein
LGGVTVSAKTEEIEKSVGLFKSTIEPGIPSDGEQSGATGLGEQEYNMSIRLTNQRSKKINCRRNVFIHTIF